MQYFKVNWCHNAPDDPHLIYTEIDDAQWELRKIEVFRNGRKGFADSQEEVGGSMLGMEPWPDLELISSDPEFRIEEITREFFEEEWVNRHKSSTST
jgi:hypothetical protein